MKNKKTASAKRGLNKNFHRPYCKTPRQEIQPVFEFTEAQAASRNLGIIECYECKANAQLDGFRFRLVPLCRCCRTEREVEITNQNFERRMKRYE
ncbi:MAG: hypothetical protein M3405_01900 [Acidobacteriota bacterium]|jgi:hypothetical protein|nr:hypothetical protein [Acidobacteriota bacterium]